VRRPHWAETAPRGKARLPAYLRRLRSLPATTAQRRLRSSAVRKSRSLPDVANGSSPPTNWERGGRFTADNPLLNAKHEGVSLDWSRTGSGNMIEPADGEAPPEARGLEARVGAIEERLGAIEGRLGVPDRGLRRTTDGVGSRGAQVAASLLDRNNWPSVVWRRGWCPMLLVALVVDHDDGAAGRLCDQAVAALLHSKDPVELQRAGIIIHELSCGISRRAEKGASEIVGLKHLWLAC
jgi:hypothetical protein